MRIGDINESGIVEAKDAKFLPQDFQFRFHNVVARKMDILIAMTGATVGKSAMYLSNDVALVNQRVCLYRAINSNAQKFVWYLINSHYYKKYIALVAFGGAQPNISDEGLVACKFPCPSPVEQHAISDFLDCETAKIDQLKQKASKCIELLKEYKTSLISSAVTGKINVRNYKSGDPINN